MFQGAPFDIIYEDEQLIAINKPCGILVHRTKISEDTQFVLQLLRDQIKQRVYPIHRLDRATSGVLLFGKDKVVAGILGAQFREQQVQKEYLAIIRGFVAAEETIDYPLKSEPHKPAQTAITRYQQIEQVTFAAAIGPYPSARYSLVRIFPQTGRRQQIRKHFGHLRHPIIGDKKHGDCKHNKYFTTVLDIPRMLLHAQILQFKHPTEARTMNLHAGLDDHFEKALSILNFQSRGESKNNV